jgi:hypothetical protein
MDLKKNYLARAVVDGLRRAAARWHVERVLSPAMASVNRAARPRVLVLGVYLADKPHVATHLVERFESATTYSVDQVWVAMNGEPDSPQLARVTAHRTHERVPKFTLMNLLLSRFDWRSYEYVVISDDDITLPHGFLDAFLSLQIKHDLALAQPARTPWSRASHSFVRQKLRTEARVTRFVEIGPITSIRRDLASLLLPFDEESPMGWGYDLVWPLVVEGAGLRLGIVDATPCDHTMRGQAAMYSGSAELVRMGDYLTKRRHLELEDALVVRETIRSSSWI